MDIVALIIDNVDNNMGTLFSLLTVNKEVFRYTCRVIYRDPFRFFRRPGLYLGSKYYKNKLSLVQLLLDLSPAVDDDTDVLRSVINELQKHGSEAETRPTTMLDYLSFIRCVRWESSLDDLLEALLRILSQDLHPFRSHIQIRNGISVFKSKLTWSLCSHQLSHIRELEIQPNSIDCYIAVASQLCGLSTIVIAAYHVFTEEMANRVYSSTVRLIQSLQEHHGKDLVRDCRFSEPLNFDNDDKVFQMNIDILEHLPLHLPRGLNLALPLRPMDLYLSRLTALVAVQGVKQYRWDNICSNYSDLTAGQILQRCRALVHLCLGIWERESDYPSILAWATDEARERAAGRLLAPAVPLEKLELFLNDLSPAEAIRVLMDGIRGFGSSLRSLRFISYERADGDEGEEDKSLPLPPLSNDESTMMPRLQHLEIRLSDFELLDRWLFPLCPNLKSLHVHLKDYPDPDAPPPRWLTLHFPNLTRLEVLGQAVFMFNPASGFSTCVE